MSQKAIALWILILIVALAGAVMAKANSNSAFGYEVLPDGAGALRLKITSEAATGDMWLGITFYPPKVKNPAVENVNMVVPVEQGRATTEIPVEARFKNGTFEAAVWGRKLSQKECAADDAACRRNGYKLAEMQAYVWGYLQGE